MRDLLASGPTRAGLFFVAAFLVAAVGGFLLGDIRQGLATGVTVGLVMAAFGYLFVRPA
jgi:tetrahydromethanopterin S-methyltransferase subunit B